MFKDPGKIDTQAAFDKCVLRNIELQEQLKIAIKALKFYAKGKHIQQESKESGDFEEFIEQGELATEALKQIGAGNE